MQFVKSVDVGEFLAKLEADQWLEHKHHEANEPCRVDYVQFLYVLLISEFFREQEQNYYGCATKQQK